MKFIDRFSEYASKELNLSEDDATKINYAAKAIFSDVSKMLILLLFFLLTNNISTFVYILFPLLILRGLTGGLHFNTYMQCFLFTAFYFGITIYSSSNIDLFTVNPLILGPILILTIFVCGPIQSKSRLIFSSKKILIHKILSSVFIILHIFLYYKNINNPYYNVAIWAIIYQTIQLLFAKGGLYYEKIQSTT